jgi:uncharacterized protein YndB with AHSA1/START domain
MKQQYFELNPDLDLLLERTVPVSPELVWKAWTRPEHIRRWFAPAPWTVEDCTIDLRPGGVFRTVMKAPDGKTYPSEACYLDIEPIQRLVFTDALKPGYRPAEEPFFTAIVTLEPDGSGTRYSALAMHQTREARDRHAEMGFESGWSTCLDQLVELVQSW